MPTMHEALARAMGQPVDANVVTRLEQDGLAVVSEDTMSQAIHDVYCGIIADHSHPNEKDREQARSMLAAIRQTSAS